jgi:hypothetical protein
MIRGSPLPDQSRCLRAAAFTDAHVSSRSSGEGGTGLMLPGFRLVCAAAVLSVSLVIFGLGAAALLRASHEKFASLPSLRPLLGAGRPNEAALPTLAMLRLEAPAATPQEQAVAPVQAVPGPAVSDEVIAAAPPVKPEVPAPAPETITPPAVEASPVDVATVSEPPQPVETAVVPPPPETAPEPVAAVAPTPAEPVAPAIDLEVSTPATLPDAAQHMPSQGIDVAAAPSEPAAVPVPRAWEVVEPPAPESTASIAAVGDDAPPALTVVPLPTPKPAMRAQVTAKRAVAKRVVVKRRKPAPRPRVVRQAPQTPANPFGAPPFGTPFGS